MKITKTDIWTVVVPTITERVQSPCFGPSGWDLVPKHIIRLHTDEGLYGLGESGRGVPRENVQALADALVGVDPRELALQHLPAALGRLDDRPAESVPGRWWETAAGGPGMSGYEAIEMAILDLLGKF
ncbi:MAG: hypothetical protein JXA74_00285, partial [Anaerolineae bacterium]|nr:hypothetical protein [Anaerolineae bacterium]